MEGAAAYRLGLASLRAIFDAATALELDVVGKRVSVSVSSQPSPWPDPGLGLTEDDDGPWPPELQLDCSWEGGSVELRVAAHPGKKHLGVHVRVAPWRRQLVWIAPTKKLVGAGPDDTVTIRGWCSLIIGSKVPQDTVERLERARKQLKSLVAKSDLPLLSNSSVEAYQLRVSDGAVLPSPGEAFRRIVSLALHKLDFLARKHAAERGEPLVRVDALVGVAEEDDESAVTDDRSYWAGGFMWGEDSQLECFLADRCWEMGWARDDSEAAARTAWSRFDRIQTGDLFAIKG